MTEDSKNLDRFQAQLPQVPGVAGHTDPAAGAEEPVEEQPSRDLASRMVGPAVAIVVLAALGFWLFLRTPRPAPAAPPGAEPANPAASVNPAAPPPPSAPPQSEASPVATLEELAQPWSSKPFSFQKSPGSAMVESMVLRLPGPANRAGSYWAFSLRQPFGKCQLEWVTDTAKLSSQYGYQAIHPMLASPCDGTLYDPLKLGTTPKGAWARGEVVHGNGIRPPIAIELRLEGGKILATRME